LDATGLAKLAERAEAEVATAADEAALEALRVRYLGRRDGEITAAIKLTPTLPKDDRPAYGAAANAARERIEAALERRSSELRDASVEQELRQAGEDLTLPPRRVRVGRYHPITRTIREVSRIFAGMGFETVEGPEVEWDYYNFEALNIPPDHPARDKFNTLWVDSEGVVELARVVRPGGTIACVEFCVPRGLWRPLWNVYVGVGLPAAGRLVSRGWFDVGRFLGPSIREFYERWPLERQLGLWHDAGLVDVRARRMSLGGGVVIWGRRRQRADEA